MFPRTAELTRPRPLTLLARFLAWLAESDEAPAAPAVKPPATLSAELRARLIALHIAQTTARAGALR